MKKLILGAFLGVVLFGAGYFMHSSPLQYGGFALVGVMFVMFMVRKLSTR